MPVNLIEDVIESLADEFAIYGAHGEQCTAEKPCRCCWVSSLADRMWSAIEAEMALYPQRFFGSPCEKIKARQ